MKCVKVLKKNVQRFLEKFKTVVLNSYEFIKEGDFVFIPVSKCPKGYECLERTFKQKPRKPKSLREALLKKGINAKGIISSFDLMGDIAVVEVPKGIDEKTVGEAIAEVHNVKGVYAKHSAVSGIYRVKKLKLIYGKEVKEVHYKENGVKMVFDPTKVFFSPRLAPERKRISELVKEGENILVLFAGVGPFALVIAKKCKTCKIVGIELNPIAVKYFKKNVEINKFNNINVIEGDVKDVLKDFNNWADRVVMPLPKDAEHFLVYAGNACKKNGVIHFYTFVNRKKREEEVKEKLKNLKKKSKIRLIKHVRDYSKDIEQVVVDVEVVE